MPNSVPIVFAAPPLGQAAAHVAWLMEHAAESTMLTDADGRIAYVNPAF
ncbi:MAG: hypothetical protein HY855_15435 [Burkholderiales bacterium]|nr:hypothetical protein [Burkholderiales bacterium]